MPLFAAFLGSLASGFVSIFGTFLAYKTALKLAAFTAWLTIFTAFLVSVYICLTSLSRMVSGASAGGGEWVVRFFMALGMFIPANAGAVISCVGSVWIATGIYKFQKDAIRSFGA